MSANLYATAEKGEYYHIHGSLEASTTLRMIGLESHRPDLKTHEDIVGVIEPAVQQFTVDELEALNAKNRQAGVKAYKHEDFLRTPHVGYLFPRGASRIAPLTCETTGQGQLAASSLDRGAARDDHAAVPAARSGRPARALGRQGPRNVPHHCRPRRGAHPGRVRGRRAQDHEPPPQRRALLPGRRQHGQARGRPRPEDARGAPGL